MLNACCSSQVFAINLKEADKEEKGVSQRVSSDTVPTKRARIKLEQVSPPSHYYRNTSASCMALSAEIGSGGKESLAASVYVRLSSDPKQRNYLLKKTGKRAVSFKYSARNTKISSKTHDCFITSNCCNKSISIHSDSSCSVVIVGPAGRGLR